MAERSPAVELIAVGTELLLGQLQDTNTPHVAARLAELGIDVLGTHGVGDNRTRIAATIAGVLARREGAVITGGLGPTVDDLTKEAVCDALELDVELYEPALRRMESFFASRQQEMPANNRKQAELPRGSRVLDNPYGTAPGFVAFGRDGKFVACMPGVPAEMRPMLRDRLVPFLRERFGSHEAIFTRVIRTVGIGESEIDRRIDDLFRAGENPKIAVLAHAGSADVKVMSKSASLADAEAAIEPLEREIRRRLDGFVYGVGGESLEAAIHSLLQSAGKTVATGESCTGGRLAAALTSVPGSSKSFRGGVVAYDNALKTQLLGVDPALIATDGAVSEGVARAMARGARERLGSDLALATTGIAGPDGGTPDKPVGLVWFALDDGCGRVDAWRARIPGERDAVTRRATTIALGALWRHLSR
ncbi:MAG TPA: competence/damage-inducible protein A [Candidatus Tumulicola sp.]|nr:competence/damage-inducible protein A [Candidatus Tumulicola sp.]